jgi:hypothetical protein
MKKTAFLLAPAFLWALALVGCTDTSNQKDHPPQPRIEDKPQPTRSNTAPTQSSSSEEPIAITIKKGDKRNQEASYQGAPPPGYVCFDFKNADLEKVALPLFSAQSGVKVDYKGPAKTLTLGFSNPVKWQDALGLVCQWTQTHATRSPIPGRVELKLGYADPAPFLAKFDPNDKTPTDAGAGVLYGSPDAVGNAPPIDTSAPKQPSAPQQPQPDSGSSGATDTGNPKQPGADKIDEIRKNVSPNNSGVK